MPLTQKQLAPQRFRDAFRKIGYELSAERGDPRPLFRRAADLLKRAKPYVWDTSRGHGSYEDATRALERYRDAVRRGGQPYMRGLAHVLQHVIFAPAFKSGDRVPQGTVEDRIHGDLSAADGWLYRVRNPRGALESLWESTIVHPLQRHVERGRDPSGYAEAKRRARGINAMMRRYGGMKRGGFPVRDRDPNADNWLVKSGRLNVGQIRRTSPASFMWQSFRGSHDGGVTDTKENALHRILQSAGMSPRQYEIALVPTDRVFRWKH